MAVMAIGFLAAAGTTAAGYGAYASAAYVIGSSVGSMLFAKKQRFTQEGARITDLKVATSSYGNGIPITFGRNRLAGNLIWATDLKEHKTEETVEQGGKGGGGGSSTTVISYTYSCSMAILLTEGVIDGISRIWADGKLIYDNTDSNQGEVGKIKANIKVYNGTEKQLPDPTIEAHEGVGKVEAYRGLAYIVVTDLFLTDFGNRIPSFSFEILRGDKTFTIQKENNSSYYLDNALGFPNSNIESKAVMYYDKYNKSVLFAGNNDTTSETNAFIARLNYATNSFEKIKYNINSKNTNSIISNLGNYGGGICISPSGEIYAIGQDGVINGVNKTRQPWIVSNSSFTVQRQVVPENYNLNNDEFYTKYRYNRFNFFVSKIISIDINPGFDWCAVNIDGTYTFGSMQNDFISINNYTCHNDFIFERENTLYSIVSNGNNTSKKYLGLLKIENTLFSLINTTNNYNFTNIPIINESSTSNIRGIRNILYDNKTDSLFIMYTEYFTLTNQVNKILRYSFKTNSIISITNINQNIFDIRTNENINIDVIACLVTGSVNKRYMYIQYDRKEVSTGIFIDYLLRYHLDDNTIEVIQVKYDLPPWINDNLRGLHFNNRSTTIADIAFDENQNLLITKAYKVGALAVNKFQFERFNLDNVYYRLDNLVLELIERTNLKAKDIDVTELSDILVNGFTVANTTTVRSLLEQLQTAYNFSVVESDYKIKFVLNGQEPIALINYQELNTQTYSPDVVFESDLNTTSKQELELPQLINVNYISVVDDYQQDTQDAIRQTVYTNEIINTDLPIVMDATKAKNIAQRLIEETWIQRYTYSFETNMNYVYIEPTDVVQVKTKEQLFTIRITQKDEDSGILKFQGVAEDSAVYEQNIVVEEEQNNQVIDHVSTTKTNFLDLPIFQAKDDNAGFYATAQKKQNSNSWNGSLLYQSDNNKDFTSLIDFKNLGHIGNANTLLNDFIQGFANNFYNNVIDYFNSVEIYMQNGELTSITEEQLYNGENLCVLGNEVLQFKTAELIAPKTYKISGLLRGRFGTEDFIASHNLGLENFFLVNNNIIRVNQESMNINKLMYYKNVTFSNTLNETIAEEFTNTCKGLQCYKVYDVQSNRTANGTLNINWKPRTRGFAAWQDYIDINDLDGDSYEIDILKDNIVIKTYSIINARNLSYTNTQQTADLGAISSSINIVIYKMNSKIGRGKSLTLTV